MRHECIILADSPGALVELCGISVIERLLRTLQRCGLTRAIILSATPDVLEQHLADPSPHRAKVALDIRSGSLIDAGLTQPTTLLFYQAISFSTAACCNCSMLRTSMAALVDSAVPPKLEPLVASAPNTSRGHFCGAACYRAEWIAVPSRSAQ